MADPKNVAPDPQTHKRPDTWISRLLGILALPLVVLMVALEVSYDWNHPSSRQSGGFWGSLPLVIVIMPAIFGAVLLYVGVPGSSLALHYPTPKTLPYAALIQQMPQSGWYRVPDATVNLSAAVARHASADGQGKDDGYYAPVYGPGNYGPGRVPGGPCRLLLSVSSGPLPPQQLVTRTVEGLVKTQRSQPDQFHADVTPLAAKLAPSSLVINEGERPNLGLSLILALAGGLLLLVSTFLIRFFYFNKGKTTKRSRTRKGSAQPRQKEKSL